MNCGVKLSNTFTHDHLPRSAQESSNVALTPNSPLMDKPSETQIEIETDSLSNHMNSSNFNDDKTYTRSGRLVKPPLK